ncbi:O-antigen ligase family protein [Chitinophaga polysaccharea]|nr:O-antigen ligase family protein [Chitinophaga polysaccharea]
MNVLLAILGGVFLLLPSVYSSQFIEPTQTTKFIFFSEGIAVVFLLLACYTLYGNKQFSISLSVLDIGLVIVLLYISVNRYYLHPLHGFSQRWLELTGLAICYIVLRRLPVRMYTWLLLAITAGGVLQALSGILQLLSIMDSRNTYFPMTGNFFNPGGYAGYLALVAVVSFGLYLHRNTLQISEGESRRVNRFVAWLMMWLPLTALVGCAIVLPCLRSRSAFLALAAGIGGVWWLYRNRNNHKSAAWPLKRIVMAAVLLAGLGYAFYLLKRHSADGRMLIYQVSATLVQEHPVIGVGMDRFKAYYMDAQAHWFEQQGEAAADAAQLADNTFYAFNEPLQFVVENGGIGFLLLVAVIFFFWRYPSGQSYMPVRATAYGVLLASLCFALFTYSSDNLAMKYIIVFALAILSGTGSKVLVHISLPLDRGRMAVLPVLSLLALLLVYVYGNMINSARKSFAGWGMAQKAYVMEMYRESNRYFEAVYPELCTNGEFLMQYGKSLAMVENYQQALAVLMQARQYQRSSVIETAIGDCEKKAGNYAAAEQSYLKAMNMIPNRFYPLYLLMTLYQENGETTKAMMMARTIKAKKVKVPSKAILEIKGFADNIIKARDQ